MKYWKEILIAVGASAVGFYVGNHSNDIYNKADKLTDKALEIAERIRERINR